MRQLEISAPFRLIKSRLVVVLCAASACVSVGCNKTEKGEQKAAETRAAKPAEVGCGTDYADPEKQFCVTLPKTYKVNPKIEKSELHSELIHVDGPDMGDGVTLSVGLSNSNFKTYEDELAYDQKMAAPSGWKLDATGSTKGDGRWRVISQGNTKVIYAMVKAANGKAAMCSTSNLTPSAAAIEVCKTLRPFPSK